MLLLEAWQINIVFKFSLPTWSISILLTTLFLYLKSLALVMCARFFSYVSNDLSIRLESFHQVSVGRGNPPANE